MASRNAQKRKTAKRKARQELGAPKAKRRPYYMSEPYALGSAAELGSLMALGAAFYAAQSAKNPDILILDDNHPPINIPDLDVND